MKTLRNLFEPKQFEHLKEILFIDDLWLWDECAIVAQKILDQFIEENGVKVYGWLGHKDKTIWHPELTAYDDKPTRTALILDTEDIPEDQCEHKEAVYVEDLNGTWFKCRDCGKPVKAKGWESCEL